MWPSQESQETKKIQCFKIKLWSKIALKAEQDSKTESMVDNYRVVYTDKVNPYREYLHNIVDRKLSNDCAQ